MLIHLSNIIFPIYKSFHMQPISFALRLIVKSNYLVMAIATSMKEIRKT